MSTLPLGIGAYERTYADEPEIKLVNRFFERTPTNPVEKTALLARPGTELLEYFAADTIDGKIRGCYSEPGAFNYDLFVVSGKKLYRYDGDTKTPIFGEVQDAGSPRVAIVRGAGYERMFITDGRLLQYYDGGSEATGTLTFTGANADLENYVLVVNSTCYGWTTGDVDAGPPAGTLEKPFLCKLGTTGLENMANMLNFIGTRGTDFSSALTAANVDVSAKADTGNGTIVLTSHDKTTDANAITTAMAADPDYASFANDTLTGGGGGPTHDDRATGTFTYTGTDADMERLVIVINGTHYGWTSTDVDAYSPDGTRGHPYLCLIGSDALDDMADMLNFSGTPGTDFSTAVTDANPDVTATSGATTLTLTSVLTTEAGNDVTTETRTATGFLAFGAGTLSGGGVHALKGIPMPNGEPVIACASLNQYVLVAVGDSQRFYFIKPGEVTIDGLSFASKESSPDNIVDMERVGDVVVIMGSASTEFWSGTGDSDTPFAPIVGRTMSRGVIDGTAVMVDERTIIIVGDDMRVYAVTSGPQPISNHGIEERIRKQLQSEAA